MEQTSLPKSWDEITIGQFVRLLEANSMIEPRASVFRMSVLSGISVDELYKLAATKFDAMKGEFAFMNDLPKGNVEETLFGFNRRDLNRITVGEFWDIEESDDLLLKLAALYPEQDEYDYNKRMSHIKKLSETPVSVALPAIVHFNEWRSTLWKTFSGLFNSGEDMEDNIPDETVEQREIRLAEKEKNDALERKWNFYGFVSALAGNDPLKFDAATELNYVFALNHLSYIKENKISNN